MEWKRVPGKAGVYPTSFDCIPLQEDVDLSADTCASAPYNVWQVERGVTEGYLYEVGGSGDTAADTREAMESEVGSQEEKGCGQEGYVQEMRAVRQTAWEKV